MTEEVLSVKLELLTLYKELLFSLHSVMALSTPIRIYAHICKPNLNISRKPISRSRPEYINAQPTVLLFNVETGECISGPCLGEFLKLRLRCIQMAVFIS